MQSKSKFELMTNLYWRVFGLILGSVFTLNVAYAAPPTSSSSVSATASAATSSTSAGSTACDQPIPFSAEEFMQKLLVVANTKDTQKIPNKFQELFAVQLQHEPSISKFGGVVYHLYGSECKWDVYLSIYGVTKALGARGRIGFLSKTIDPLPFVGGNDACLSPELVVTALKADGWVDEGHEGIYSSFYSFHKDGANFTAHPRGLYGSGSNRHWCFSEFYLYLSPAHK